MKTVMHTPRDGAPPLPPGTRLNGIFEIERVIGTGGMGIVYKGRAIETGDAVAIKVVRTEMAHNTAAIELFRKEAAVLRTLLHDAIVRYYVFTTDPGIERPYLATEFVDGEPLSEAIRAGPLGRQDGLALLVRLAEGLEAAHRLGVVHRDIAPDNIILPAREVRRAKIIDFGIARATVLGKGTLIGDSIAGKFDYMSPEQLGLYGGNVDGRSDVYSLAIVIAEALTGRPLGMGGSQAQVVEKRRCVPPLVGIDGDVKQLLSQMLQPKPADRLGSMSAVAEAARRLAARPAAQPKRRRALAAVAALVVVGVAGAGAWIARDSATGDGGEAVTASLATAPQGTDVAAERPIAPPRLVPRASPGAAQDGPASAAPSAVATGERVTGAAETSPAPREAPGPASAGADDPGRPATAEPPPQPVTPDASAAGPPQPSAAHDTAVAGAADRDGSGASAATGEADDAAGTIERDTGALDSAAAAGSGDTPVTHPGPGELSAATADAPPEVAAAGAAAPSGADGEGAPDAGFEGPDETMSDPERIVAALTADAAERTGRTEPGAADPPAPPPSPEPDAASAEAQAVGPTIEDEADPESARAAIEPAETPERAEASASANAPSNSEATAAAAAATAPEADEPGATARTGAAARQPGAARDKDSADDASVAATDFEADRNDSPPGTEDPAASPAGAAPVAATPDRVPEIAQPAATVATSAPSAAAPIAMPAPPDGENAASGSTSIADAAPVSPPATAVQATSAGGAAPGAREETAGGAEAEDARSSTLREPSDATVAAAVSPEAAENERASQRRAEESDAPDAEEATVIASIDPEETRPPAVTTAQSATEKIERYLAGFDFGPCGLIRPRTLTPDSAQLVGYGTDIDRFVAFDTSFAQSFGFEAKIELRLVEGSQCPVLAFLREAGAAADELALTLDSDVIAPGRTLSGVVRGLGDRPMALLVVAPDGTVYPLDDMATRSGDQADVHTPVSVGEAGRPHLLVALAGETLTALPLGGGRSAAAIFALLTETVRRGEDVSAGVAYFKFDG